MNMLNTQTVDQAYRILRHVLEAECTRLAHFAASFGASGPGIVARDMTDNPTVEKNPHNIDFVWLCLAAFSHEAREAADNRMFRPGTVWSTKQYASFLLEYEIECKVEQIAAGEVPAEYELEDVEVQP
jgi:hypothetical protein